MHRYLVQCAVAFIAAVLYVSIANAITVTDLAGRTVKLDKPATKIILGEGRFMGALGILERKDPIAKIAGMLGDFKYLDPAGYRQYKKHFPAIGKIPLFGLTSATSVSVEKAIALKPEVAIFGLSGHGPSARSKALVDKIKAAGIKVVFIDFRDNPLKNTLKSMEVLGKVLGREKEANEYAEFYKKELAKVTDVVKGLKGKKPKVFLETHVGNGGECCRTIRNAMISAFIEFVGGHNMAKDVVMGVAGTVSLEYVIAQQPDVYIGTAIGTIEAQKDAPGRIVLGADVSEKIAQASFQRAMKRKGFHTLNAVKAKNAHGVWHHFYNTPLNIVAMQAFAKWIHPKEFKDLDPEKTLAELYFRFQPVPYTGKYIIDLE